MKSKAIHHSHVIRPWAVALALLAPACDSAVEITVNVNVPATEEVCGDGHLGGTEQCDDDIDNGPDARCRTNCMLNVCGDGDVGPEDECDDGPDNGDNAACKSDCTFNVCGDGVVGPLEGCDDGNDVDDDACSDECVPASCGDGVVQAPEACDDGNALETDACTTLCTVAACGDGFVQPDSGEGCDDGPDNDDNGNCTSQCAPATCGDGLLHDQGGGTEVCDDGPDNGAGGACRGDCTLNVCGDGYLGEDEVCDDGNLLDGDTCVDGCSVAPCGNSVVDPGEACDDGKDGDWYDGCNDLCEAASCGDGYGQPWELCETMPGADIEHGACPNNCQPAYCGDGFVWLPYEQCDDGWENNGPGQPCESDCTRPSCGNGELDPGEECDDGNTYALDGCTDGCRLATCGDGLPTDDEECDGGPDNMFESWDCTPGCQLAACGDGMKHWLDEDCDDGNNLDGDGCNADCTLPTRVFVTSSTYTGNLGGVAGAMAKCQQRADAAGLGGTWDAWISVPGNVAGGRFPSNGHYARLDGVEIAQGWLDLRDGTLDAPINVTEWGVPLGQLDVWTGTAINGTALADNCNGWTDGSGSMIGHEGRTSATDDKWTNSGAAQASPCSTMQRLYCIELETPE
ncbi:DUF4215 domain-containing protein [Nannocystis sp. SCPEA4]|uniref:DUF4215 domain-containing protein n=1 Tax=Nannocystis sp. SCPEA4 TaxID=2996787 RepID=UPI002271123C|nr:DUF4215 domain-containing protein [Nannocystis sp. SCPEA4]MCY1059607.1 DUF4215 domain-containing protein [Nannocystis sp. SCPEA4]